MLVVVVRSREQILTGMGEGIMSHTSYEGIANALCMYEGKEKSESGRDCIEILPVNV